MPPNAPMRAQTLSGDADRSTLSATVCNCVLGEAKYGNVLVPGFVAPVAPPCRNSRSLFTIQVIMMSMTFALTVRPPPV